MKDRARLKDVARLAGVSASTVSRVSSNHPDVSEETKQKVEAAMKTLGYRPFALAQGLVSGRSHTLGLLVSDIANPFYPQLASAIEETANEEGYVVFLCNTCDNPERSKQYIDRLLGHGVDGIIHASVGSDEEHLHDLIDNEFPLVFINRRPANLQGIDLVAFDSVGGAREAVKHLVQLGHRKIGFLSGPLYISTEKDRLAGFKLEMEANGISIPPGFIQHIETSRQKGCQAAHEMLARPSRPTAIIANDIVAYGVLDAALDLGLRVPQDLSIIGFGAIEGTNLGPIHLTTISSRIREMGKIGCQRLIEAIDDAEHQPKETILKVALIERDTTAKAPV
ncbi:MAG: LacI family transcriptional regulator [Chloroflexi bacterium]|nr:LacI family transcriptional regulator [Chloroflexota bacterium]